MKGVVIGIGVGVGAGAMGLFGVSIGIGLRIRDHPTDPPSAQELIMTSHPSTQEEGIITRRLEHKSFISKPLETKPGSALVPMEGLLGLPEGSRAKRCPGSGPLPVSRVSATHPNPAWRPKQPNLWPPIPSTLYQTVPRAAPEPHRSTSDLYQRHYGEVPVRLR